MNRIETNARVSPDLNHSVKLVEDCIFRGINTGIKKEKIEIPIVSGTQFNYFGSYIYSTGRGRYNLPIPVYTARTSAPNQIALACFRLPDCPLNMREMYASRRIKSFLGEFPDRFPDPFIADKHFFALFEYLAKTSEHPVEPFLRQGYGYLTLLRISRQAAAD